MTLSPEQQSPEDAELERIATIASAALDVARQLVPLLLDLANQTTDIDMSAVYVRRGRLNSYAASVLDLVRTI